MDERLLLLLLLLLNLALFLGLSCIFSGLVKCRGKRKKKKFYSRKSPEKGTKTHFLISTLQDQE